MMASRFNLSGLNQQNPQSSSHKRCVHQIVDNPEPSTHGPERTNCTLAAVVLLGPGADIQAVSAHD